MSVSSIAERLYRVEKIEVPLYHCTSLAGLIGIVDSQSLFATDMRYFNDSQGLLHTCELIEMQLALRPVPRPGHRACNRLRPSANIDARSARDLRRGLCPLPCPSRGVSWSLQHGAT